MSFADDVRRWNERLLLDIDDNIREVAHDLLGEVQQRTPVDTGELRKSWVIAEVTLAHYVISTDKAYVHVLEYGLYRSPVANGSWDKALKRYVVKTNGGYSIQAPQGFVRLAMVDILAKWRPRIGNG